MLWHGLEQLSRLPNPCRNWEPVGLRAAPPQGTVSLSPCVTDVVVLTPAPTAGERLQGQQLGMARGRSGNITFLHTWHVRTVDEPLITPAWSPGITRKGY